MLHGDYSSSFTGFYKYLFPPLWIGIFGWGTLQLFTHPESVTFNGLRGGAPAGIEWLFLALWLAGSAFILWLAWRLAWVRVAEGRVYIRRFSKGLRSLGVQSDRLLVVIDELYGTAQHPRRMRPQTDFTGISLEGDPRHLNAGATKIKLFFESEDEKRYAELYLNIDLGAAKLELAEKDPDYRAPIVRALSAP